MGFGDRTRKFAAVHVREPSHGLIRVENCPLAPSATPLTREVRTVSEAKRIVAEWTRKVFQFGRVADSDIDLRMHSGQRIGEHAHPTQERIEQSRSNGIASAL